MTDVRLSDTVRILEADGQTPARVEVRMRRNFEPEQASLAETFARALADVPPVWPCTEINLQLRRCYFEITDQDVAWPLYDKVIDRIPQRTDLDAGPKYRQPRSADELAVTLKLIAALAARREDIVEWYRREHELAYSSAARGERIGGKGSGPSNPTAGVTEDRILQSVRRALSDVDRDVTGAAKALGRVLSALRPPAERTEEPTPNTELAANVAEAEAAQRRRRRDGEE